MYLKVWRSPDENYCNCGYFSHLPVNKIIINTVCPELDVSLCCVCCRAAWCKKDVIMIVANYTYFIMHGLLRKLLLMCHLSGTRMWSALVLVVRQGCVQLYGWWVGQGCMHRWWRCCFAYSGPRVDVGGVRTPPPSAESKSSNYSNGNSSLPRLKAV